MAAEHFQIFIQAHLTFLVIMAATYTGSLGPFLVSSLPLTVMATVYGPTELSQVLPTIWVLILEATAIQQRRKACRFSLISVAVMDISDGRAIVQVPASFNAERQLQEISDMDDHVDVHVSVKLLVSCWLLTSGGLRTAEKGASGSASKVTLGAYDMLDCSGPANAEFKPDALIYDAPLVILTLRNTGYCSLKTIGNEFFSSNFGIGFMKDTPYARAFSIAIQGAIDNGDIIRQALGRGGEN
eukprot:60307-Hanusia_phi.AAC.2